MRPNGQLPAYEWSFSDVNPPVHAWACWRVYKMTAPRGQRDRLFLERAFQKLLITFTWWVNRKDDEGNHLFSGGFLGLDNIGVFDRSRPLPGGASLEQADGTAWMAFFCITMLAMALELARKDPAYEDVASKFFEHFVAISDAINNLGGTGPLERGGRLLLRPDAGRRPADSVARALDGGDHPPVRGVGPERGRGLPPPARLRQADALVPAQPPGPGEPASPSWSPPAGRTTPSTCSPSPRASGWCGCCATCWTRRSSSRPTASGRCRATISSTRSSCPTTARSRGCSTSPASRGTGSSAATPTGGGRSGFRSTTC